MATERSIDFDWTVDFTMRRISNSIICSSLTLSLGHSISGKQMLSGIVRKYDLFVAFSESHSGMAAIDFSCWRHFSLQGLGHGKVQSSSRCLVNPSSPGCLASTIKYIHNIGTKWISVSANVEKYKSRFLINDIASRWENLF